MPHLGTALGATRATVVISVVLALVAAVLGAALLTVSAALRRLRRSHAEVARRDSRSRALADQSAIGVLGVDAEGRVTYANPTVTDLAGLTEGQLLGPDTLALIAPDDRTAVVAEAGAAIAARKPYHGRFRLVRGTGEVRWVHCDTVPLHEAGVDAGWVGSIVDVTGDVRQREQLERMSEIIEKTPLYICVCEVDGRFRYLNEAARQAYGLGPDDDVSRLRAVDAYAPASRQRFLEEAVPTALAEGAWSGEVQIVLPGGEAFPASQVIVAHRVDDKVDYFFSITSDLSEQKAFEAKLVHHELHDALTRLPNRVLLLDRLAQAIVRCERRGCRVGVLFVDIDDFKLVNDSYGHDIGDVLLLSMTARLQETLPTADTIARFSGDEFCVVIDDVSDDAEALEVAHQLATTLSAPYEAVEPLIAQQPHQRPVFITVSVGVAVSAAHGSTPEALLRDADAAVHRAKETGGGRVELFTESLRRSVVRRLQTSGDLHRAVRGHEFQVVYQPEVDLASGHIVAVEALLRWHHPQRGLIPPSEFVPLAEQTNLIEPIGAYVLETAFAQAATWRAARWDGAPLPVWVNISGRQLGDASLVAAVRRLLTVCGVDAAQVGLEVTETALPADAEKAILTLGALRRLGVRLAIDDFGTGYSSLSYLKRLPVDAVKVDRTFVDGLGQDSDDSAIVSAVVGMATALRLQVIAEGVETATQLAWVRRLGCHAAQGYYLAGPQPPEVIDRLLAQDRARPLRPPTGEPTEPGGPGGPAALDARPAGPFPVRLGLAATREGDEATPYPS